MVKLGEQFASYFFFRLSHLVVRLKHAFLCAFFIIVSSASAPSLSLCSVVLIRIHSPMRADPNRVVKWVPDHHTIRVARIASEKFLRSLENNSLSGSIPASIWLNFTRSAKLTMLAGNPICKDSNNIQNIGQYCASEGGESEKSMNSTTACPAQACPADNFYEYVTDPHVPCYCAAHLRIGYRLKSPSFSYFSPYRKFC
ncbi:hypothetical protein K1719_026426 [Acacia pycnantha]|nr:hypothetical protein K1719_026426 [Acacia pycnantha]